MGTELTGARTNIGVKLSSTWSTAGTIASTDGIEVLNLSHGENAEELSASPIGSGDIGTGDAQRGATSPSVTLEKIAHYNDKGTAFIKQFFGSENAYTAGSGGYTHSFLMNETFNQSFVTIAFQCASVTGGVAEYPTGVVTRLGWTLESPPSYVKMATDILADQLKTTGQTNSMTILDAATLANTERVVLQSDDGFWLNAAGGAALSGSDAVSFTSCTIELQKPHEHVREVTGGAGVGVNGQPVASGTPPLMWTVTLTMSKLTDMAWYAAMRAGTEYKAQVNITGSLIGGAVYNKVQWFFPRLKLISDVQYNLSNAAINPVTVVFKGLVAATAPTGMLDKYPYLIVTNTKSSVES